MTIAEQMYEEDSIDSYDEGICIGGFLTETYYAIKYEDQSILVVSDDHYDCFTGGALPIAAFSNFNEFEEWVKEQPFFKHHKTEYKSLA